MKYITLKDANKMIIGSSIYSTGGGFELSSQKKQFEELYKKTKKIPLVSIEDLKDTDYVCTAYAVGSSGNTNFDLSKNFLLGICSLENLINKRIAAIFEGETNIDVLAFQIAHNLSIPVLDADATGGRAVPEIQIDNFSIANKSTLPLIAVTPDGKVIKLAKAKNLPAVETFVRGLLKMHKEGLIAVLDHAVSVSDAKHILTKNVFRRALNLGEYIETHKNNSDFTATNIANFVKGELVCDGIIQSNNLKDDPNEGFLSGYYSVLDQRDNSIIKIFVKNENLILWKNNIPLITPPHSIIVVDTKKYVGLHNSKLRKNQKVAIISKKANNLWLTANGKKLFSARHFGFPIKHY